MDESQIEATQFNTSPYFQPTLDDLNLNKRIAAKYKITPNYKKTRACYLHLIQIMNIYFIYWKVVDIRRLLHLLVLLLLIHVNEMIRVNRSV